MTTVNTLSLDGVLRMLDGPDKVHLVNVLGRDTFNQKHIPGSFNMPVDADSFVENMETRVPRDELVVVYCASQECDASTKAASQLTEAGFENVYDFEGGVAEWEAAGRELVGSAAGTGTRSR